MPSGTTSSSLVEIWDHGTPCSLFTHESKFDEPALLASSMHTEADYIGALGTRLAQRDRRDRRLDPGLREEELARISAPCGFDIGAWTPEETAISIIANSAGGKGRPLSHPDAAIHDPPAALFRRS